MFRIGLISDTHGLLRPEAVEFLKGSDHIIHAGDIGTQAVIDKLARLAPVTAVRGNNDRGDWAEIIPETEFIELAGIYLYIIHDAAGLDIDPEAADVKVVVAGHSHIPMMEQRGAVLYANPGSSGPRRFKLPVAAGELMISNGRVCARTVELISNQDKMLKNNRST